MEASVRAGFQMIHLDAGMDFADDHATLSVEIVDAHVASLRRRLLSVDAVRCGMSPSGAPGVQVDVA